jgi:uncharacterized protein YeaO (DUF488 family)
MMEVNGTRAPVDTSAVRRISSLADAVHSGINFAYSQIDGVYMIKIKRIYEKIEKDDGYRVLVDRLWPRGVKKAAAKLDQWFKEIAPSEELRKNFGHDPSKWKIFKSAYLRELRGSAAKEALGELLKVAKKGNLTLLFAARDEEHNNAVVLKQVLDRRSH